MLIVPVHDDVGGTALESRLHALSCQPREPLFLHDFKSVGRPFASGVGTQSVHHHVALDGAAIRGMTPTDHRFGAKREPERISRLEGRRERLGLFVTLGRVRIGRITHRSSILARYPGGYAVFGSSPHGPLDGSRAGTHHRSRGSPARAWTVVKWSHQARRDLRRIFDYIVQDSPHYVRKVTREIAAKTGVLNEPPRIGKMMPEVGDDDIRELYPRRALCPRPVRRPRTTGR